MVSLFIFLILVFILFELYFFSFKIEREKFTATSKYDNYFNGDILMNDGETPINIGVGTEPNSEYLIDVNGKLTVNGNLQVGTSILNYDLAKKINKLPLYSRSEYCLYDSDGNKQCINENQLGMITGHNKVMFKNRYGETLSNLTLKHHGPHNRSDMGRPYTGKQWNKEGIQYRDLNTSWHHDSIMHPRNLGYPFKYEHDTLENSSDGNPNSKNQFKLIPIEEEDTRISDDDPDIKNIILYTSAYERLLSPNMDSIWLTYQPRDSINNILGKASTVTTDKEKFDLQLSIQQNKTLVPGIGAYLKLQKLKKEDKYYIRVYDKTNNIWKYLQSVNNNDNYNNGGRPISSLLVKYPTVRCKFTIASNTNTPFSVDNIYQDVYFKTEDGRLMVVGVWNGWAMDWGGGISIRFLLREEGRPHSKFSMYIVPNISLDGGDDDFVPRKEYKCVG